MPVLSRTSRPLPRGCAVIFGLVFLAGGLAAVGAGVWLGGRAWIVRGWEETGCRMVKAETDVTVKDGGEWRIDPVVEYQFTRGGKTFTGRRLEDKTLNQVWEPAELEQKLADLRAHPDQTCLVNPDDPAEAVLEKPAYGLPLAAVAGGALFAFAGLMIVFRTRRAGGSRGQKNGAILLILPAFFLGFAAVGGFLVWSALQDRWKEVEPRLQETPCVIVASSVKRGQSSSSNGRQSATYKADVLFRYEWEGRMWHSNWVSFSKNNTGSSNRSTWEEVVRRYPAGARRSCRVDKAEPWVAALEKGSGSNTVLWVVAGVFGGIGLLGFTACIFRRSLGGFLNRKASPPPAPPDLPL